MILTSGTGLRALFGCLIFVLTLGALACGGPEPAVTDTVEVEEPPPVVETRWTTRSELFVEYPPLVEGETSRFAIHFTDLSTFEPVRAGRAVVHLTGAQDEDQEFGVEAPGRPGIFGVDVTPNRAGRYRLEVVLDAPGLTDRHDLGDVTVLTAADATALVMLAMTEEPADASIPFLKEQQWALDFATARAERRQMSESLVLAAEIEPRTGGRVDVTTPVAGRLAGDLPQRPVGSPVARGDTLAEIIPHSGHGEDRPALELDVAEARHALELARAASARVERLVAVGALPTRRQLEARLAEQTAQARVTASEAHLAQLDSTRSGEGEGARDIRFVLRAPISGVVAESDATPGASVEEGARLFRLRRPRSGVHRRLAAGSGAVTGGRAGRRRVGGAGGRRTSGARSVGRRWSRARSRRPHRSHHLRALRTRTAGSPSDRPCPCVSSCPRPPRRSQCPKAPSSTMRDSRSSLSRWPARASSDAPSSSAIASRVWCRSRATSRRASESSSAVRRSSGWPPCRRRSRRTGTRTRGSSSYQSHQRVTRTMP